MNEKEVAILLKSVLDYAIEVVAEWECGVSASVCVFVFKVWLCLKCGRLCLHVHGNDIV